MQSMGNSSSTEWGAALVLHREQLSQRRGLLCDGSLQGWAAPATRAQASELEATISIPAAGI
jgi:hypothetical protein